MIRYILWPVSKEPIDDQMRGWLANGKHKEPACKATIRLAKNAAMLGGQSTDGRFRANN